MWSATRKDGAHVITARTDNKEFDWKDRSLNFVPDPVDAPDCWQLGGEGQRFISRCADSFAKKMPVRLILRDREDKAEPWVDPRFYWGIITHVGIGDELGHIRGKVLPLDGYDPVSNTFQGK